MIIASTEEAQHLSMVHTSFFNLMSWETSSEKDGGFSAVARALGVEISLADSKADLFSFSSTDGRKAELDSNISKILKRGGSSAKEFETLRGRLFFAENQVFGRISCHHMQKLSRACKQVGLVSLDDELLAALLYLRDRVILGEFKVDF